MSKTLFPNDGTLWTIRALDISGNYGQKIDLSSNNTISFQTSSSNRLRITDPSSIFLNNVDLSANNLVNVNNITVSRANPQVDASYNFTIVRISTDASARNIAIPTPYNGQLCFLLNSSILQYYNNGAWSNINQQLVTASVTGFILNTNYEIIYVGPSNNVIGAPTNGGYTIYRFYPTTTTTGTFTPNFSGSVDYLVVGGGGGGGCGASGSYYGGGGGAGGYRTNYSGGGSPSLSLVNGTSYSVTVGQGGVYTNTANTRGTSGANSVFSTITSSGGGGGAGSTAALSGGSGGGASFLSITGGTGNAGSYSPVEGYAGGNYNTGGQGAPGGGASGAGSNTSTTPPAGLSNSITGTSVIYGYGGGGNPSEIQYTTQGSGGKGGRDVVGENGANGIAGIVIIRFPSFI